MLQDVGEDENVADMVRHPMINQPTSSTQVAATGKVIQVPSILQSDKHVAVRVVEDGSSRELSGNTGRPLYGPIHSMYAKGVKRYLVVSKILPKKDSRSKKKDEFSQTHTEVSDWAAHLSKSLVTEEILGKSIVPLKVTSPSVNVSNEVQWIENSTFECDVQLNVQ
ncbi:hypothetical protein V6N13_088367 [Hibiscus sabdariffa]|uniref:Uncharacterized protein n=1 Tax=Hibiscus sabdariffa TaxID=183260 RepID=A0ABR2FZ35_9ROSI